MRIVSSFKILDALHFNVVKGLGFFSHSKSG